jgi:hypothetical protein
MVLKFIERKMLFVYVIIQREEWSSKKPCVYAATPEKVQKSEN